MFLSPAHLFPTTVCVHIPSDVAVRHRRKDSLSSSKRVLAMLSRRFGT